jgi:hypothetical protein
MSNLNEAFKISRHSENKDFVDNPYVPVPTLTQPIEPNQPGLAQTCPQNLTMARCFDVKYGSKNYFAPTYYSTNNNK